MLFGRSADVAALRRAVAGNGLVTISGPPGVGKTALARELYAGWRGRKRWVDLADARTGPELVAAVVRAVGLPRGADIAQALGADPALVVLDNFEQLLPRSAAVPVRWSAAAPAARIVVTSRERLGFPRDEAHVPLEPLGERAAIALFTRRARGLARRDAKGVQQLVAELDGIPLAIELAAARTGVLRPAQILARLPEYLASVPRRGVPKRHQGLVAAIAWSWELLTPLERRALAQCATFRGGFTVPAAEAVLELSGAPAVDVLQSLTEKSLVRQLPGSRVGLYVPVRAFAAQRLTGTEADAFRARHAAWFARLSDRPALETPFASGPEEHLETLAPERENLLDAFAWARARDAALAARLFLALKPLLLAHGPIELLADLADAVEGGGALPDGLRVRLLSAVGAVQRIGGRPERALDAYRAAQALAGRLGDGSAEAQALAGMAAVTASLGDLRETERCLAAAERVAAGTGDAGQRSWVLICRAHYEISCGRSAAAVSLADEALQLLRRAHDAPAQAWVLSYRGVARHDLGRIDDACADYRAALELARESGDARAEAYARGLLALAAAELGDARTVRREGGRAVEMTGVLGDARLEACFRCAQVWRKARSKDAAGAAADLERVEAAAQQSRDRDLRMMASTLRGLVELAAPAAPQRWAAARRRAESVREDAETSWDGRWALRLLDRELERFAAAQRKRRAPKGALVISPDGRRFKLPQRAGATALDRYGPASRLLARLAEERLAAPGRALGFDELVAAVWPGQRMLHGAAFNRLHVALSKLRASGLKQVLLKRGGGYQLDPRVPLALAPLE